MDPSRISKHAPWALPLSGEWEEAIEGFLQYRRAAKQPETSLKAYRTALAQLGRRIGVGPWQVTAEALEEFVSVQPWGRETGRTRRQTFLNFYKWGIREGHVTASPAEPLPPVKTLPPKPRPAPEAVYRAALAAAAPRERLMLRLAAEVGMRRGEVACVHSRDILQDYSGGWSIDVHGKGDRDRVVPIPESLAREIQAQPRGYLFPGERAGHLSPEWVGRRLTVLMPERWAMHALRHRFATRAFAKTGDLIFVQTMLGHSSPETTRRYIDYDRSRMRAVVEDLAS